MPAIAVCSVQISWASTTPVRSTESASVDDQPGVAAPIYSNIPACAGSSIPTGTADSPSAEQLLLKFMDEHSATNYPAAVETALRLVQAAPDRPHGHYNLACALARLRRIDESIAALEAAMDAGWRDLRHLSMDPDLAAIRNSAGYGPVVDRLQNMRDQERIQPAPLRTDDWHAVVADITTQAPAIFKRYHVTDASMALVNDGRTVWMGTFAQGSMTDASAADAGLRFRLRRPVELIGLIAGASLQEQGRLTLAQIIEQGAELERTTRNRNGNGAKRRDEPPPVSIVPIGQRSPDRAVDGQGRAPFARIDPQNPTMSVLRLAIEIVANQPFGAYCRTSVVEPLDMTSTSFERQTIDKAAFATGHTVLGTPMPVAGLSDDSLDAAIIYTTAGDLAKLVETLLNSRNSNGDSSSIDANPINLLARVNAMAPVGTASDGGLAVQVRALESGRRVQLFEITDGVGCLMRWHARNGNGIVILFDAATGGEAAIHVAHLALGGE